VNFLVRADGQPQTVRAAFGAEEDIDLLRTWGRHRPRRGNLHARDSIEFAKLARKWWQYYQCRDASAASFTELKRLLRRHPRREFAFMVLAQAQWLPEIPVMGLCCCRRTWCNHIVLEFAAVNPKILDDAPREIRGVGAGMLYSLIRIADQLKCPTVWGEATENSAPFYERVLRIPRVGDHFIITGKVMERCRSQFEVMKSKIAAQKA
jgi:hypothetical protein